MIAEDVGEPVARQTAQQLVVYRRRPGGQSQFSALLEWSGPADGSAPCSAGRGERLETPLTIETLAARAAMSPRNFARRFTEETGLTPARAIERLRVESAREQVEGSAEALETIARRVGFRDPERCGARSCARSASRRRRCGGWRGADRVQVLVGFRTGPISRIAIGRPAMAPPSPSVIGSGRH